MRTKKRILAMIMSVVLVMTMMTGFAAAEGTEYTVGTAEELAALVLDYQGSATLTFTADIDMTDVEFYGLGDVTNLTVSGNGYTISGLTAPLFYDMENCSVSGLNIEAEISGEGISVYGAGALAVTLYETDVDSCNIVLNCDITDSEVSYMGGLAGVADLCGISNCYVSGTWNFEDCYYVEYTGGLIGDVNSYMNISNCITDVDMNMTAVEEIFDVGGFLGGIEGEENFIDTCYTLGDITISDLPEDYDYYDSDYYCVGGFAGWTESATYTNCGVFGDIINNTDAGECIGGFIGEVYGNIWFYNCFSTADVSGTGYVGGFMGACWDYDIEYTAYAFVNCYSSGKAEATKEEYGNAFVGYTDNEDIFVACYANVTEGIGLYNYKYDVITEADSILAITPDDATSMEELEGSLNEFVEAFTGDLELYDWILANSKGTPVHKGISFEIAVVDETGETVATETVYLGQDLSDYDFESLVPEKEGYTVEIVTDVASLAVDFVNADIEIEVEYTEIPEVTPEVTPEATPEVTPEATPEDAEPADPTQPDTGDNGIIALVGLMILAGAGVAVASRKRA